MDTWTGVEFDALNLQRQFLNSKKILVDCFKAGPFYIRPFVCFSTVKTTFKPVSMRLD